MLIDIAVKSATLSSFVRKGASFFHNCMDQAESMKLMELVEKINVSYVVASSYLSDSASTPVKRAFNIGPR